MDKQAKICKRCGIEKSLIDFRQHRNTCRLCERELDREYREKYPEKIKVAKDKYQKENSEKLIEYYEKNKEQIKLKRKEYYRKNKDRHIVLCIEWQRNNKEKRKIIISKWRKNNREKCNEIAKNYRNKHKTESKYRLNRSIGISICKSLKNNSGSKNKRHWETLVSYSLEDLKNYLEKQFKKNMNWNNFGEWHIDHIIPISAFNFSSPEHLDFQRCWSLDNLQPLWAKDNLSKGNKLKESFQSSLAL